MLKSYKQFSRWYGPLEPETGPPIPAHTEETSVAPGDDEGPARYPHYIREEDTEQDPDDLPTDLPSRRSEFTGGWSDWVAGHAPGPDDDYTAPRVGDLVRFPWPDEEFDEPRKRPVRVNRALRLEARARSTRRGRTIALLVAAVLLLAAAAGVLFLLRSAPDRGAAGHTGSASNASVQFTAGSVTAPGAPCPTERTDTIVRGAEQGGAISGPDAVLAFQYAYYVERSGERAREMISPDAVVSSAAVIQRGIDSIPAGTTHCVRIVTVAENKYLVEVTEYRPGGAPATYNKQMVTTAVIDAVAP